MELRPYQHSCIQSILNALMNDSDKVYIKLATGAGKTIIYVKLVEALLKKYPNMKTVFVVPKNILIEQTVEKFNDKSMVGIYNAGLGVKDLTKPITIATVQSLVRAIDLPEINLLVFDECHRAKGSHTSLYSRYKEIRPKMKLLGMTATDYDIDKDLWNEKIFDIGLKELTEQGFLCPIICMEGEGKVDLRGVKVQAGDYSLKELKDRFTTDKISMQVNDLLVKAYGRNKVIVLTTCIDHAQKVKDLIPDSQIIHSKMSKEHRDQNLDRFKSDGKYLISVLIASEGFDFPEADCLALMRPTRSATLYEQAVGRIARNSPGKENGLLLDYGQVVENLGFVYDITPIEKGVAKVKVCSECEILNEASASKCYACGECFMVVCEVCLKTKKYGESCCKKEIDRLKNLTLSAYEGDYQEVDGVKLNRHISAKGNVCVKADHVLGFRVIISEYLTTSRQIRYFGEMYCPEKFDHNLINSADEFLKEFDSVERIPKGLKLKKNDKGFNKIVRRKW